MWHWVPKPAWNCTRTLENLHGPNLSWVKPHDLYWSLVSIDQDCCHWNMWMRMMKKLELPQSTHCPDSQNQRPLRRPTLFPNHHRKSLPTLPCWTWKNNEMCLRFLSPMQETPPDDTMLDEIWDISWSSVKLYFKKGILLPYILQIIMKRVYEMACVVLL